MTTPKKFELNREMTTIILDFWSNSAIVDFVTNHQGQFLVNSHSHNFLEIHIWREGNIAIHVSNHMQITATKHPHININFNEFSLHDKIRSGITNIIAYSQPFIALTDISFLLRWPSTGRSRDMRTTINGIKGRSASFLYRSTYHHMRDDHNEE